MTNGKTDWRENNIICVRMRHLMLRTEDVINGDTPLLIAYGPPGIGKSKGVFYKLKIYSDMLEQKWKANNHQPERRSAHDEQNPTVVSFNPPYRVVTGQISYPVFHGVMYHASYRGEVLLIDDVTSLSDPKIQAALQQSSDPTHNGLVQYGVRAKLPDDTAPKKFNFMGGTVLITNFRKDDPDSVKAMRTLFNPAVLDRAEEVDFPWDEAPLYQYVTKLAFGNDPKQGLYEFMLKPRAFEADNRDMAGLGFKGGHKQAIALQQEIFEFYRAKRARVTQPSFRMLRKWMTSRILHPKEWEELIEGSLSPLPTLNPKNDKGPEHAHLERPGSTH